METSWSAEAVSKSFNQYNDMLEHVLGFHSIFRFIEEQPEVKTILDFGCGPGKVSERMALLDSQIQIVAVDQSENMIEIAKTHRHHENIVYQVIQNESLDFLEDESIDFAILCFVIINNSSVKRIEKILREIQRVLRKGGCLAILDSHPKAVGIEFTTFTNGEKNKIYEVGERKQQHLKIMGKPDLILHDWYWDERAYLNWLAEAGFNHVTYQEPTIDSLEKEDKRYYEREYGFTEWGEERYRSPFIIFRAFK